MILFKFIASFFFFSRFEDIFIKFFILFMIIINIIIIIWRFIDEINILLYDICFRIADVKYDIQSLLYQMIMFKNMILDLLEQNVIIINLDIDLQSMIII